MLVQGDKMEVKCDECQSIAKVKVKKPEPPPEEEKGPTITS